MPTDPRRTVTPACLLLTAAALIAPAAPASASTTIGQTSAASMPCTDGNLLFQGATAAGRGYAVPLGGEVITSWSTYAGAYLGSMKVQIVRPGVDGGYSVVAESPPQELVPDRLNTFPLSPPLPVRPGDLLGVTQTGGTPACSFGPGTFGLVTSGDTLLTTDTGADPPLGATFIPSGDVPTTRLNVSATVDVAAPLPPRAPAFAGAKLVSTNLRAGGRFVTVRLRCSVRCAGRARLSTPALKLGRARFRGAPGRRTAVRIRMSAPGRWLLATSGRLDATVTTAAHDESGRTSTTVAGVTISARAGRGLPARGGCRLRCPAAGA